MKTEILGGVALAGVVAFFAFRPKKSGTRSAGGYDAAGSPSGGPAAATACMQLPTARQREQCLRRIRSESGARKPMTGGAEGSRCETLKKRTYAAVMDGVCGVIWAPNYDDNAIAHAEAILAEQGDPAHICNMVKANPGTSREYWTSHPDMIDLVRQVLGRMFGDQFLHEWPPPAAGATYLTSITWSLAMAAVLRGVCDYVPET